MSGLFNCLILTKEKQDDLGLEHLTMAQNIDDMSFLCSSDDRSGSGLWR